MEAKTDADTIGKLKTLAASVVAAAEKVHTPRILIPSRSLTNVSYHPVKRMLRLGPSKIGRELFNIHQAKSFMQTLLTAAGCKTLIESGKTTSLRGLYYMLKHTLETPAGVPLKEETFAEQGECDTIIEELELTLGTLREELHLYAKSAGAIAGPLIVKDGEDVIDCSKMGTGGYTIPSIVESHVLQFLECKANFILHVEKDTVWRRFNEDKFWKKHDCLVTHGGGQPPRGVRRMLARLHRELKLPVYCLLDNDPWGYYIYSVIKQGSINLAFESERMAVPDCRYIGLRSVDADRCQLGRSVQIRLNDTDRKRAEQIAAYPWFATKREWQREIERMLKNGYKLEVESLISKDISYVTEEYVPARLAEQDFLD